MEHKINCPTGDVSALKVGDRVFLSGIVYTARDAAHGRMLDLLAHGKALPIPVENAAIYYVGPTPHRDHEIIGSAGPTTSGRMDAYAPTLLDMGLKIMIGKGGRSKAVKEAVVRNKAVYLGALGGAGALMAAGIETVDVLCWEDLGCEAIRQLTVKELPLTVVIDSQGNDLYETGPAQYLESIS